jgi:hypothetical protein
MDQKMRENTCSFMVRIGKKDGSATLLYCDSLMASVLKTVEYWAGSTVSRPVSGIGIVTRIGARGTFEGPLMLRDQ